MPTLPRPAAVPAPRSRAETRPFRSAEEAWFWTMAALVARQRPLVLIFVSFLFAGLRTGSGFLRSTGVSARIADVVQGMLVLAMLLPPAILYVRARRRALAATSSRT